MHGRPQRIFDWRKRSENKARYLQRHIMLTDDLVLVAFGLAFIALTVWCCVRFL